MTCRPSTHAALYLSKKVPLPPTAHVLHMLDRMRTESYFHQHHLNNSYMILDLTSGICNEGTYEVTIPLNRIG